MFFNRQHVFIYLTVVAALLMSGCDLFENEQKPLIPDSIFGTWELVEIRYDNGETLKPDFNESYWFELKEDTVLAEKEYQYSLEGQSNCNYCFGYYDLDQETQDIKIAFVCNRLICGMATEFASSVATTFQYSFTHGKMNLFFETATEGKGHMILIPRK